MNNNNHAVTLNEEEEKSVNSTTISTTASKWRCYWFILSKRHGLLYFPSQLEYESLLFIFQHTINISSNKATQQFLSKMLKKYSLNISHYDILAHDNHFSLIPSTLLDEIEPYGIFLNYKGPVKSKEKQYNYYLHNSKVDEKDKNIMDPSIRSQWMARIFFYKDK